MPPAAIPPARFTSRQRAVLVVLLGAGFMLSVDFSVLTVALPDIGAADVVVTLAAVALIATRLRRAPDDVEGPGSRAPGAVAAHHAG